MKHVQTKRKNYCVHIFVRHDYENVEAKNAQEAEDKIVNSQFAGNYEDISEVQVMLQCDNCGYDNEPTNKKCDECGVKL